jgi:hypothetical protein
MQAAGDIRLLVSPAELIFPGIPSPESMITTPVSASRKKSQAGGGGCSEGIPR